MANLNIDWGDGSGDILVLNQTLGGGDAEVQASSTTNYGLDRSRQVYVSAGSTTKTLTIHQTGMREIFNASDGSFLLSDGTTFNVLKS